MRSFWKTCSAAAFALAMLGSCDVMEKDADADVVSVDKKPAYLIANSTGFIDIASRVKAPGKVKIELSDLTRRGELKDLGKGLLQYTPFGGSNSRHDSFRFSIISDGGVVMTSDTLGIILGDSTDLPCAIYPRNDYAYNAKSSVTVDVLLNDVTCAGNVTVSINNDAPPTGGTATVVANKVVYTPGAGFTGKDKVVYKASMADNSVPPAFGILYVSSADSCRSALHNDMYITPNKFGKRQKISINVLDNDVVCSGSFRQFTIPVTPKYGSAEVSGDIVIYTAPDTIRTYPFNDQFTYQICIDGVCNQAIVKIRAGATGPCTLAAVNDAFDLSQNDIKDILLDILNNDELCDITPTLTIVSAPLYGKADATSDGKVWYSRHPSNTQDDSFKYKICSGDKCEIASVNIKLQ